MAIIEMLENRGFKGRVIVLDDETDITDMYGNMDREQDGTNLMVDTRLDEFQALIRDEDGNIQVVEYHPDRMWLCTNQWESYIEIVDYQGIPVTYIVSIQYNHL